MSDEFPEGWALTTLGDGLAVDVQPGFACGAHNRQGKGIPHLRPMNVSEEGQINLSDLKFVPKEEAERDERLIRAGDLLFNNTNSPALVGKTAYYADQEPRAFSNHMTRVRCHRAIIDSIFCAMVLHQKWREGYFESVCNNHVSQASVSRSVLLETPILLPPLAEQKRIVAKVKELLARVNAARERLSRVPMILKRFRQSVLAAACSGRLTVEWRRKRGSPGDSKKFVQGIHEGRKEVIKGGSQTYGAEKRAAKKLEADLRPPYIGSYRDRLPSSWVVTRIGDVADCLDHIRVPVNKNERQGRTGGIPYYGANGQVGWIDKHLFDEDLVLVVEDESFIGRENPFSYVVRGKSWVNNHAHVLRPLGGMPADYLNELLAFYDFVPLTSGTTGRRKLTRASLLDAEIAVAPLDEQSEIVRRVEAIFALADTIEKRVATATVRVEKLTQAILARAFRGELVPTEAELARQESRDYEPASALLERIRAARVLPATRSRAKPFIVKDSEER